MRTLLCLLTLSLSVLALADGGMYTREVLSAPTIPHQRALVSFKDGTEVMIVESRVRGEAGEYGWLIPVPSKDVKVEVVSPGLFDALEATLPPAIEYHRNTVWIPLCTCVAATLLLGIALWARRSGKSGLGEFALATLFIGMFAFIGGSALDREMRLDVGATAGASDGGETLWRQVGAYQVAEVSGTTLSDPLSWLKKENLAPRGAEDTIQGYLKEGWSFVALRFDRENEGEYGPHPVKLTFATQKPIYPMRLTAHNTNRLELDLYVVSKNAPIASGMQLWRAEELKLFYGRWLPNGHPELQLVAELGDVLSRFHGRLTKVDMSDDILIGDTMGKEAETTTLWPAQEASKRLVWLGLVAYSWSVWILGLLLVIAKPSKRSIGWLFVVCVAAIGVVLINARMTMPIVETETETGDMFMMMDSHWAVNEVKSKAFKSVDKLIQEIGRRGGPIAPIDTVMGYSIFEEPEAFVVVTFDQNANPMEPVRIKRARD